MRLRKYLYVLFLLFVSNSSHAIVIEGREWRQVNDTLGLSWSQVSTVCSPVSGVCNGSTGGVDFNGWTWASIFDVRVMFSYFNQSFNNTQFENDSEWAPKFLNAFYPSPLSPLGDGSDFVLGISRTSVNLFGNQMAFFGFVTDHPSELFTDSMTTARTTSIFSDSNGVGAWLFQDAIQVPEPKTYLLMGLGILGLIYARRRSV